MKQWPLFLAVTLAVSGCAADSIDRGRMAEMVGEAMTAELMEPLEASVFDDQDHDAMTQAVEKAIDTATNIEGVERILHSGVGFGSGGLGTDLSVRLVVVPDETEQLFCMDLAMASTGDVIVHDVAGDPLTFCDDVPKTKIRNT
jgi:hypothetical protein